MRFAKFASLSQPPKKIKFIFDRNLKNRHNAECLYQYMINVLNWPYQNLMDDEMGTATNKSVGIQVADLFAREVMKHYDNKIGPQKRPMRHSLATLVMTLRFNHHFYDDTFWNRYSDRFGKFEEQNQLEYQKWLTDLGIKVDNLTNRIAHLIFIDSLKKGNHE